MWPKLRPDIEINETGHEPDGTPTWVIYDPLRRLYFRIGWVEHEILIRWNLGDANKISESINNESTLKVTTQIIEKLIDYLKKNNLVEVIDEQHQNELLSNSNKKSNIFKTVLQRYIAFYIPLVRPNKFLNITFPVIKRIFFHKTFIYFIILLFLISIYLIGRQWDEFINSYDYFFNFKNLGFLFFGIFFVKLIHELGHAYAAKYYDCHIASMGVAFLVVWPLMYTDTTDTWKLKNRNHRIVIQAAGMIAEICLAVIATFFWAITEDGVFRSIMFYIATISWVSTILVNCNPVIRFDGYHVFADFIKVDNLQQRSFMLGSWKLKQILLGIKDEQPVQCPDNVTKSLIIYAFITWIYRFFLFIGIAIIIYNLFFKALGVILMAVEIIFLLIMPIVKEVIVYIMSLKERGGMTKRATISLSVLLLIILILVVPWKSSISIPAVLQYSRGENIYVPYDVKVEKLYVKKNDIVKKGDVLAVLYSPELETKLKETEEEIKKLENRISNETSRSSNLSYEQASENDLQQRIEERDNVKDEIGKLKVKAQIDGQIISVMDDIKENNWIKKDDLFISISDPNKWLITSYISEDDIKRIKKGDTGKFYPYTDDLTPINTEIVKIYSDNEEYLESPYLASVYQGDIAVVLTEQGQLKVEESIYKVLSVISNGGKNDELKKYKHKEVRGELQIKGVRESLIVMALRPALNTIVRESGF